MVLYLRRTLLMYQLVETTMLSEMLRLLRQRSAPHSWYCLYQIVTRADCVVQLLTRTQSGCLVYIVGKGVQNLFTGIIVCVLIAGLSESYVICCKGKLSYIVSLKLSNQHNLTQCMPTRKEEVISMESNVKLFSINIYCVFIE